MSLIQRANAWWRGIFPWIRVAVVIGLLAFALKKGEGPPRYEVSGKARLVDGDSLVVERLEIRMKNIDAPEGRQSCQRNGRAWRCGQEATKRLRNFIARRTVSCAGDEYDRHHRLLAICTVSLRKSGRRQELNKWMVKEGWAVAFGAYRAEERAARKAKKGLWSSTFQRPRAWRRDNSKS